MELVGLNSDNLSFHAHKQLLDAMSIESNEHNKIESLTPERLLERVENILLDRIKNGNSSAYFQLGLLYFEQVSDL